MSRFHSGLYRCCISPVQWGEYHYHCVKQSTKGSCELAAPSKKGDPTKRGLIFIFKPNIMIESRTRVFLPFGSFGLSVQARPHIVITLLITQTSFRRCKFIFFDTVSQRPTTSSVVQLSSASAITSTPITKSNRLSSPRGCSRSSERWHFPAKVATKQWCSAWNNSRGSSCVTSAY